MFRDLRFAIRMFAKSPGATAAAVISLAVAIGPNCALFSVVDRLFLKPPPVPGISRIFFPIARTDRQGEWESFSYPDVLDYQAQAGELGSFAASDRRGTILTNPAGQREIVRMDPVSENYFSVLGARAAAGRILRESDAHFEGQPPAVISYSLWQRQFDGATDAVGKTLFLTGRPFSLVGIMPRGFRGPEREILPPDVWIPFSGLPPGDQRYLMRRGDRGIDTLLRLRDGVDKARAEAVLTTVARRLASQYPDTNKGKAVILDTRGGGGALATIVLSLAGLVLLIACANIAGILVAQGEARRQELAVRAAMGASRGRLVRQLIAESLLLSLLAAGVGVLLALWLIRAIPALNPLTIFTLDFDFRVDSRVLMYTLSLALLAALAAGLVPSLRASRPDLVSTLKGDAPRVGRRFRFRGALVIAQVAISQFLLVGTGLLVRSYLEVQRIRPGFDPGRKVLAAFLVAPGEGKAVDFAGLADKLRAVPGVLRVSFTDSMLLSGSGEATERVMIPGVTPEPVEVGMKGVGAEYFAVMGTQLLRGRDFDRHDSKGAVVVNETMARQIWGSPDAAMGKVFRMEGIDCQVLGVAENGKYRSLQEKPMPFLFAAAPLAKGGEGILLIETATAPAAMAGTIRKAIHDAEPDALVVSLTSLRQHMRYSLFPYRVAAGLVGTIGILGMFLAGVGLYGLVSYSVGRRTREIGVRVAMGAGSADVLSLVLREALLRVAIGAVIGLAAGLAAAQVIRSALYGVSAGDPIGIVAAVAVVAAVGLLAAYVPARRALRVNPMEALREQ
jgi:putative ABC transport system permease protein